MSEIHVMVPLSLLEGTNLGDPQSIAETLQKAVVAHATIPILQQRISESLMKVGEIGSYLEELINNSPNTMERAQKIRQLIEDCKNYANGG